MHPALVGGVAHARAQTAKFTRLVTMTTTTTAEASPASAVWLALAIGIPGITQVGLVKVTCAPGQQSTEDDCDDGEVRSAFPILSVAF